MRLQQILQRLVDEIGLWQAVTAVFLGTFILGLIPMIGYVGYRRLTAPYTAAEAVLAEEQAPPIEDIPPIEPSQDDVMFGIRATARYLAAQPAIRRELRLRKTDFSPVTTTLANRGILSDWVTLSNESKISICLYLAAKTHGEEPADDRAYRVLLMVSLLNATADNEAAADLSIEQACKLHDKGISDEVIRAGWRADEDI